MISKMPVTEEEFLEVNGVGLAKLERYGEPFLEEIRAFQQEQVESSKGSYPFLIVCLHV